VPTVRFRHPEHAVDCSAVRADAPAGAGVGLAFEAFDLSRGEQD
jgi:hypothetical protein